jgi:2-oxoglutarate ferredoxin oxidoreductase subunit delta
MWHKKFYARLRFSRGETADVEVLQEGDGSLSVAPTHNTKIKINEDWCKKCGVCQSFCPKKVLGCDELGRVVILDAEQCIACKICERICPDFAINIEVNGDD